MSDRWLDLDRLAAIEWRDNVIDPRQVTFVLRGVADRPATVDATPYTEQETTNG